MFKEFSDDGFMIRDYLTMPNELLTNKCYSTFFSSLNHILRVPGRLVGVVAFVLSCYAVDEM